MNKTPKQVSPKKSLANFQSNNPELRPPRMSHIRHIKPEFFLHEGVAELNPLTRLAWIGLWTVADKDGRFDWRPKRLKLQILPFDNCDFREILSELESGGFVVKYSVDDQDYGFIPNWTKHQGINARERNSKGAYPDPVNGTCLHVQTHADTCLHRAMSQGEGEGECKCEGKCKCEDKCVGKGEGDVNALSPLNEQNKKTTLPPAANAAGGQGKINYDDPPPVNEDLIKISGLCWDLTRKTPNPGNVIDLLARYPVAEIEAALREYVGNLEDREIPFVELTFFAQGGADAVIGVMRKRKEQAAQEEQAKIREAASVGGK